VSTETCNKFKAGTTESSERRKDESKEGIGGGGGNESFVRRRMSVDNREGNSRFQEAYVRVCVFVCRERVFR
jgi:hypothetical protein